MMKNKIERSGKMLKFSKSFKEDQTYVKFWGPVERLWHKVESITGTRVNIQVENLSGLFRREHVSKFTNIKPQQHEIYSNF